jgi:hypothetical protein
MRDQERSSAIAVRSSRACKQSVKLGIAVQASDDQQNWLSRTDFVPLGDTIERTVFEHCGRRWSSAHQSDNGTDHPASANDLQADEKTNHRRSGASDGYPLTMDEHGQSWSLRRQA